MFLAMGMGFAAFVLAVNPICASTASMDRISLQGVCQAFVDAARASQPKESVRGFLKSLAEESPPPPSVAPQQVEFICVCGNRLTTPRQYAGMQVQCPYCHTQIIVPSVG
jgi:DNA-directed RNA polymerase subunit RPC12/RpoP